MICGTSQKFSLRLVTLLRVEHDHMKLAGGTGPVIILFSLFFFFLHLIQVSESLSYMCEWSVSAHSDPLPPLCHRSSSPNYSNLPNVSGSGRSACHSLIHRTSGITAQQDGYECELMCENL